MATYSFILNGLFPHADAQAVGERLEALADKHDGSFTKDDVLADAAKANSPLNSCFEWNDRDAAEKYRRGQVKNLLGNLAVEKRGKPATRAFVFVATGYDDDHGYVALQDMMQSPTMRAQVAERGQRQLKSFLKRYRGIPELAPVLKQIERTMKRMERSAAV